MNKHFTHLFKQLPTQNRLDLQHLPFKLEIFHLKWDNWKKLIIWLNQPPVSFNPSAFSLSSLTLCNYALQQSPNRKILNSRCCVVLATTLALHFYRLLLFLSLVCLIRIVISVCGESQLGGGWFHGWMLPASPNYLKSY